MPKIVRLRRAGDDLVISCDGASTPVDFPVELEEPIDPLFGESDLPDPAWISSMKGSLTFRLDVARRVLERCLAHVVAVAQTQALIVVAEDEHTQHLPFELAAASADATENVFVGEDGRSLARAYSGDLGHAPPIRNDRDAVDIVLIRGPVVDEGFDSVCFDSIVRSAMQLKEDRLASVTSVKVAGLVELAALPPTRPDVVVLVAHGEPDGTISFGDRGVASAHDVADALRRLGEGIVVLAVCHAGDPNREGSLARALLGDDVPIVIAPRGRVLAAPMAAFTRAFLKEIVNRRSIDQCAAAGHRAVLAGAKPLAYGQILFFTATQQYSLARPADGKVTGGVLHGGPRRRRRLLAAIGAGGVLGVVAVGLFFVMRAFDDDGPESLGEGVTTTVEVPSSTAPPSGPGGDPTLGDAPDGYGTRGDVGDEITTAGVVDVVDNPFDGVSPADVDPAAEESTPNVPAPITTARGLSGIGEVERALEVLRSAVPSDLAEAEIIGIERAELLVDGTEEGYRAAHAEMIDVIGSGAASPALQARALLYQLQYEPDVARPLIENLADSFDDGYVQLVHAQLVLADGDPARAAEIAAAAETALAEEQPAASAEERAAAALVVAEARLALHDPNGAADAFRRADALQPIEPRAAFRLVDALEDIGSDDAIEDARARLVALEGDSDTRMEALRRQGLLEVRFGTPRDGLALVLQAIDLEAEAPPREQAANHLAHAEALGATDAPAVEVEAAYDAARSFDATWDVPHAAKARWLRPQPERAAEELELLRSASQQPGATASTWLSLCSAETQDTALPDDNFSLADAACRQAYALDRFSIGVLNWSSYVAEQLGDDGRTELLYAETLDLAPQDGWTNDRQCDRAVDAAPDDLNVAIAECEEAAQYTANDDILRSLAGLYRRTGRLGEAEEQLRAAREMDPQSLDSAYQLADLLNAMPGVDDAEVLAAYDDAAELVREGTSPTAAFLRAHARAALGADDERAAGLFDDLAAVETPTVADLVDHAAALLEKDLGTATTLMQQAVSINPLEAYRRSGTRSLPEDLRALARARLLEPEIVTYEIRKLMVDEAYGESGRCDVEAVDSLARQFAVADPANARQFYDDIADCHWVNGDTDALRTFASEMTEAGPQYATYATAWWYYDALHSFDVDDPDVPDPVTSAIELLEEVIEAEPDDYIFYSALRSMHLRRGADGLADAKHVWVDIFIRFEVWEGGLADRIDRIAQIDPKDPDLDDYIDELDRLYPDSRRANEIVGIVLVDAGDLSGLKRLREAVAAETQDHRVYERLAKHASSEWEAARFAAAAAELASGIPSLLAIEGNRWYDIEEWDRAEAAYLENVERDPDALYPVRQLINLYIEGFDQRRETDLLPYLDRLIAEHDADVNYINSRWARYWATRVDSGGADGLALVERFVESIDATDVAVDDDARQEEHQVTIAELVELAERVMRRWPSDDGYRTAIAILDRSGT